MPEPSEILDIFQAKITRIEKEIAHVCLYLAGGDPCGMIEISKDKLNKARIPFEVHCLFQYKVVKSGDEELVVMSHIKRRFPSEKFIRKETAKIEAFFDDKEGTKDKDDNSV